MAGSIPSEHDSEELTFCTETLRKNPHSVNKWITLADKYMQAYTSNPHQFLLPKTHEFLHPLILAFAPDIEGFTLYLVDLRDSFSKSDKAWEQIQVHYRRINGRHVQKMRRERSNRAVVKAEELYGATDYHTRLKWVANLEHKWSQRRLLYLDEQRAAFSSGRIDTEARTELLAVFWEVVDTEIFEGKELPTWS